MRIQSDQRGAYRNGFDRVTSIIQSVGDWELDVSDRRTTRAVYLDLSDALANNPGPAPFVSALVKGRFIAKATVLNGNIATMTGLGSTILSPLSFAFSYGGVEYGLRMNQNNHPRTDWARVTCIGVNNPGDAMSACNKWRITPTGTHDASSKNVGYLEKITSSGSNTIGHYYLTFDIILTK